MSTEEARMEPASPSNMEMTTTATPAAGTEAGAGAAGTTGAKTGDINLAEELREFGKQIEGLFQTARTSPRGKEIETQLTAAWRDVETGVNTAIGKAQSSDIKGTVSGTAQYATEEVQSGLARGLHSLNVWMSQKMQEAEERRKKREEEISKAAATGTADNDVADRFGNDAPVFGQDLQVPAASVNVTPDTSYKDADNPIADRYSNP